MRPTGTLGIETASGAIVAVARPGAPRVCETVFTTVADSQRRAILRFYYRHGDRGSWGYLDSVCLDGIPPAAAGEPDLRVLTQARKCGELCVELRAPGGGEHGSYVLDLGAPRGRPGHRMPARRRAVAGVVALGVAAFAAVLWAAAPRQRPRPEAVGAVAPPVPTATVATDAAPQRLDAPRAPSRSEAADSYEIRWGDTLAGIADKRYGDAFLYEEIARVNELPDPDFILAGQSLLLPAIGKAARRGAPPEEPVAAAAGQPR